MAVTQRCNLHFLLLQSSREDGRGMNGDNASDHDIDRLKEFQSLFNTFSISSICCMFY